MADTNKESLSQEELNVTLQFASGLYNGLQGFGYATPFTQNQNLIGLTNIPTDRPTYQKILEALEATPMNTELLQGYSEFMEVFDTIYGKTIDMYSTILAFDLEISCRNVKDSKEWNSKEYKDDLKRVYKFLDQFGYKQQFQKVVKQICRTGVSFNTLRDSDGTFNDETMELETTKRKNFALQFLPQQQCLITGYYDKGSPLFDFNMNYFLNGTVDINLFDPSYRSKFRDMYADSDYNKYNPSAQLNKRNDSFANYVQVSPNEGNWCFKWDVDNFSIVPPFASLLKTVFDNETVSRLQIDKDLISAYFLLAGEMKTMDGLKSEKPNQFAIDPKTVGTLMNLVTSGLKKNVKPCAFPLEEIKGWQYNDQNPNMAINQYRNSASQGVSASGMIYSTDKMSLAELQNALITDYNRMAVLYPQFENFLDFYVNKKTSKYKFNFIFKGSTYPFEREMRRKHMLEMADRGFVLNKSSWASVSGYTPQDYDRMLQEAKYSGMVDELVILPNRNTMKDGIGGGQEKAQTELKDGGALAQDYK